MSDTTSTPEPQPNPETMTHSQYQEWRASGGGREPLTVPDPPAPVETAEDVAADPAAESETAEGEEPEAQPEVESPQKRGAQTRNKTKEYIETLRDQRARAEALLQAERERAERAERQARELLEARQGAQTPTTTPAATSTPGLDPEVLKALPPEPQADDLLPDGSPRYGNYEAVVRAQAIWAAQYALAADKLAASKTEAERRAAEAHQAIAQRVDAFVADHPDYHEVVNASPVVINDAMREWLSDPTLEQGPALVYYLAGHPEECRRISQLPPLRSVSELGALAARLAQPEAPPPEPRPVPVTRAPAPITPVRGATVAPVPNPSAMSYQEYRAFRERAKGGG